MKPQKWLLSFGFVALAITMFVLLGDAVQMQNERMRNFDHEINTNLKAIAFAIENETENALRLAQFLSLIQKEGLWGKRESTHAICGKMLACSPSIDCFFVCYNANTDGQDALFASRENTPIYVGPYGQFASLWERDSENQGRVKPGNYWTKSLSREVDRLQTQMLQQAGQPQIISDPRHNERTHRVIRLMAPIIIENAYVGMSGLEIKIDHFYKEFKKLKKYPGLEFFVISQDQRIVTSSLNKNFDSVHINDLYLDRTGQPMKDIYLQKDGYRELKRGQDVSLPETEESKELSLLLNRYFGKSTAKQKQFQQEAQGPRLHRPVWVSAIPLTPIGWHMIAYAPEALAKGRLFEGMLQRSVISLSILIFMFTLVVLTVERARSQEGRLLESLDVLESGDIDPSQFNPQRFSGSYVPVVFRIRKLVTQLSETIASLRHIGAGISEKAARTTLHFNQCMRAQEVAMNTLNKEMHAVNACHEHFLNLIKLVEGSNNQGEEAASRIQESIQTLKKLELEFGHLGKASEMFSSRLNLINEKSQNIYKIVNLFSAITEKTNLLSFNASIEAEKTAGHSSEFIPISEKLRRLSKQTEDTNKEIEAYVRELHASVFSGVVELDKFSEAIQMLVKMLLDTLYRLDLLFNKVKNFISKTNELGREIEKQARNLGNLSFEMGTITQESAEYLTLTQENLAGMKSLQAQSEELVHKLLTIKK